MTEELTDATLFQLVNSFVAAVLEGDGEYTIDLEKLDAAIDRKAHNYMRAAHFIRAKRAAIYAEAMFYKNLYEGLYEKCKVLDRQDDRMEAALLGAMKETGKTSIETPLGTLKIKKLPHVEIDSDLLAAIGGLNEWPETYVRKAEPEVNKKALLNDYRVIFKRLSELMPEDQAIAEARKRMPEGCKIVYDEGVGGF